MLTLSGLREGFARGFLSLHRAALSASRKNSANSNYSRKLALSACVEGYEPFTRKSNHSRTYAIPRGRGVLVIPIFALQCLACLPASSARLVLSVPSACSKRSRTVLKSPPCSICYGLLAVSFLPLNSFFPLHTKLPLISLLIPLLTQKQRGVPQRKNVGAPTFLIFRTFLPLTGQQHNRGKEERSWPRKFGRGAKGALERPALHWGMRLEVIS